MAKRKREAWYPKIVRTDYSGGEDEAENIMIPTNHPNYYQIRAMNIAEGYHKPTENKA